MFIYSKIIRRRREQMKTGVYLIFGNQGIINFFPDVYGNPTNSRPKVNEFPHLRISVKVNIFVFNYEQ